jgi:hypothetical protein
MDCSDLLIKFLKVAVANDLIVVEKTTEQIIAEEH